jgi:glycosyltransferase involved in cell wall biosynthesis
MKTVLVDLTTLNTSHRLRGIGRHVRELVSGLAVVRDAEAAGVRLVGLTRLEPSGAHWTTEDLAGFEGLDHIREPSLLDDQRAVWARRLGMFRAAHAVGAALVHLPDPLGTPRLLDPQIARLVTCHDLADLRPVQARSLKARGAAVARKRLHAHRYCDATHVIAISACTAEDLKTLLGVGASRVTTVYNGVDTSRWAPTDESGRDEGVLSRYGLLRGAYALYVGDAVWRKNRTGMLHGLSRARALRPDLGLHLAWAGRLSPSQTAGVDAEAREIGIRHAVRLLGWVPDRDLGSLYRCAAAHLFVSRHEGFGLTVVEAMASGCPVITTRRTSLAEVAGDAAVDVDPDDFDAIGKALVRVATDSPLREDLARRGIARARLFSNERQANETLAVYRRLLEAGSPSTVP